MSAININIFGLNFTINTPDNKEEEYIAVAKELNDLVTSEYKKLGMRHDVRAAIQTAFMLAIENRKLKQQSEKNYNKVNDLISQIDNKVNS